MSQLRRGRKGSDQENMTHDIPPDTLNSNIEYCIEEYVRNIEHREILRESWFQDKSFEKIAQDHDVSVTTVKNIIYGIGDKVLLKASSKNSGIKSLLIVVLVQIRELTKEFLYLKQNDNRNKPYG